MRPDESFSPFARKRASPRIRAMAPSDGDVATIDAPDSIVPPAGTVDDGGIRDDDAPIDFHRGGGAGGDRAGGGYANPGTAPTTGGVIAPPVISSTPPPRSASDLSERKRLALAYAMGENASAAVPPSSLASDGGHDGVGRVGESSGHVGGRRGRGGRKKVVAPVVPSRGGGGNASSHHPPLPMSPGYPPASELISGTVRELASRAVADAAAAAAAAKAEATANRSDPPSSPPHEGMDAVFSDGTSAATTTNNAATNKRGRPRKDETTTTTTTTTRQRRKGAGRPRKAILPPPASRLSPPDRCGGMIIDGMDGDLAKIPHDDGATRGPAPVSETMVDDDDDRDIGGACDKTRGGIVAVAGPYEPLSLKRSPSVYYDEEYARFMRSIIGDDQTVFTFATLRTTTTTTNNDADAVGEDGTDAAMAATEGDLGTVVGSQFETTLEDDDVSYHLTSDDDEGDDDDDDDDDDDADEIEEDDGDDVTEGGEEADAYEGEASAPATQSSSSVEGQSCSSSKPSLLAEPPPRVGDGGGNGDNVPRPQSPDERANDEYYDDEVEDLFEKLVGEIEELMEEDLEAAVMASLIGGPSSEVASGGGRDSSVRWDCVGGVGGASVAVGMIGRGPSSRGPGGNAGAVMGTMQQRAITTPGASTKKRKSTTTVVTTPPPCSTSGGGRADGDDATSSGAGGAIEVPAVSRDQMARLRGIMARHHQLLLQQATLSVRAAYVQKVRKDGVSPSKVGSNASLSPSTTTTTTGSRRPAAKKGDCSTLPESRLDTRSLTFCINPYAGSECSYPNDFHGGETPEELSEILDGAVGMLQDLEQNWKDAVRSSIQLPPVSALPATDASQGHGVGGEEAALFSLSLSIDNNNKNTTVNNDSLNGCTRRLTRSAFTKTLRERELEMNTSSAGLSLGDTGPSSPAKHHPSSSSHATSRISVFDIRGLSRLKESFSALDNSVKDIQMGRERGKNKDGINILSPELHGQACEILLKHARSEIDMTCLPGGTPDLGECLTHAPEAFDEPNKVNHPLTKKQEAELRMNRHTFTAGEDNLILRGVNLYGEKEWCLVSDRFLPDRVVNSISQRYNRLLFLIYRANGIEIDDKGKLAPIPTFPKGSTYDVAKCANIRPATAPTTMNVHRWTLEEDVAILKAVPIMGSLWAEICTRLMSHRDRGHIRKRYQVLQRRIPKGITNMSMKYLKRPVEQRAKSPPKSLKRATASRSPAKKRDTKKKNSPKSASYPFVDSSQQRAGAESASPAKIFQLAAQAHKQQPPISPIKGLPEPQKNSSNNASRALFQALETMQSGGLETSPETRVIASVLGGFSQGSRLDSFRPPEHEENSHMGVEKILGNNDDWSQASGMRRLIEAGAAESNFVRDHRHGEAGISSYIVDELPLYKIHDGEASGFSVINGNGERGVADGDTYQRKSILTSVLSNARKRLSGTAFPGTPTIFASPSRNSALAAPEGYPSSIPSSAISFNLNTPSKDGLDAKEELSMNQEFFEYFMSEKSRHGTAEMSLASPTKTSMLMSPIKIGRLAPATPLSQYGAIESISGPLDGDNSLFDAVVALKDLSNSAPNTPSKLLRPRDGTQPPPCDQIDATDPEIEEDWTVSRKKPKTSFFGQVKAKVEERKTN